MRLIVLWESHIKYLIHIILQLQKKAKSSFDKLVTAIYDHSHHLVHESDFAKNVYTGTMYITSAIGYAHSMIREIVKKYIKEVRFECADAHEFDN